MWADKTESILKDIINLYENSEGQVLEDLFKKYIQTSGWSFGKVMKPENGNMRGSLTGPNLFELIELLGNQETIDRLNRYIIKYRYE